MGEQEQQSELADRLQIRQLIEDWVVWRDSGQWDRFATLWHRDGVMVATWFRASAFDFIASSRAAWDAGMNVVHSLGGTSIDIAGTRAVANTKMQICQRGIVHGVVVDVICQGSFIDALEKRDGKWGLLLRHPAYTVDRMAPVDPEAKLKLDKELLESFPEAYRHLGYLQTQIGLTVDRGLPTTRGAEIEALRQRTQQWLAGGPLEPTPIQR